MSKLFWALLPHASCIFSVILERKEKKRDGKIASPLTATSQEKVGFLFCSRYFQKLWWRAIFYFIFYRNDDSISERFHEIECKPNKPANRFGNNCLKIQQHSESAAKMEIITWKRLWREYLCPSNTWTPSSISPRQSNQQLKVSKRADSNQEREKIILPKLHNAMFIGNTDLIIIG